MEPERGSGDGVPAVVRLRAAVIESGFGILWFGWGQQAPPPWLVPVLVAGVVACAVVVVVGVAGLVRGPRPAGPPPKGVRTRYWALVGLEAVLAFVGAVVLVRLGRPELVAAWVCLVVGLHFGPLASIFPRCGLAPLGILVILVAVAGAVATLTLGGFSSTVVGPGAGLCLVAHSVLLLAGAPGRVRQRRLS